MSENPKLGGQDEQSSEPRKVSLADAVKRKLARQKAEQAAAAGKSRQSFQPDGIQKMKSQKTKKTNNQKRRTGV